MKQDDDRCQQFGRHGNCNVFTNLWNQFVFNSCQQTFRKVANRQDNGLLPGNRRRCARADMKNEMQKRYENSRDKLDFSEPATDIRFIH